MGNEDDRMSKTIECPVKKWAGAITLKTNVGYADMIVWDDSVNEAEQFLGDAIPDQPGYIKIIDVNRYRLARLPGLLHFVESHTLKGLPAQLDEGNFPALPPVAAARLFVWLRDEVSSIIAAEDDDEKKGGA
jgi:hypothetical protein